MPLVQVEVLRGRSPEEKKALLDAVHTALVEALKIPNDDRVQRLIEHDPNDFDVPISSYTIVTITMFPGRSDSAKRNLYQGLVSKLEKLGIRADDLSIVLQEPPLENWGIRGGLPASEVDLGFQLDV